MKVTISQIRTLTIVEKACTADQGAHMAKKRVCTRRRGRSLLKAGGAEQGRGTHM
jgi:hypothetical protein